MDFIRDFAVTSARFSNIIERIFVVPRLIFNSIKKLTEKNKIKFQTFNLENCAHFGVFFFQQALAGAFFFLNHPPPPLPHQELNGWPPTIHEIILRIIISV